MTLSEVDITTLIFIIILILILIDQIVLQSCRPKNMFKGTIEHMVLNKRTYRAFFGSVYPALLIIFPVCASLAQTENS